MGHSTTTYITSVTTTPHTMNGSDMTHISGGIRATSQNAVFVTGADNYLTVDGYVRVLDSSGIINSGQLFLTVGQDGQIFQQANGFNLAVHFAATEGLASSLQNFGTISGAYAVAVTGDDVGNTLQNFGMISSTSLYGGVAIYIESDNNAIENFGTITGLGRAIDIRSTVTGNTIFNQGDITGSIGIEFQPSSTTAVENFGTISGSSGTAINILGSGGKIRNFDTVNGDINAGADGNNMVVVNYGTVNGDILLGNGTDKYFGRDDGRVAGAVRGGSGADTLDGGNGADYLYGDQGNDLIRAGDGNDVLNGGSGVDTIKGNAGRDAIDGGDNSDFLFGGADADTIKGGNGNDRIMGGRGDDVMTGNAGADIFIFQRYTDDDVITDFQNNVDKLDLSAYNVNSRNELFSKGGIFSDGSGSIIDLTVVGGDGIIMVEDMSVGDWSASDFIF